MQSSQKRALQLGLVAVVALAAVGLTAAAIVQNKPAPSPTASQSSTAYTAPPKAEPLKLTVPASPSVLFIGDSFTQGFGADDQKTQNYATLTAAAMGWSNVTIDGVGYTGFARAGGAGGQAFTDRVTRHADAGETYDLIIFQSGLNDSTTPSAETATKITETLTLTRERFPDADIAIVGPFTYRMNDFSSLDTLYRNGANANGALYVSPVTGAWISKDEKATLLYTDGWHPNAAGYARMSEKLVEVLQQRIITG